ncbi:MAG: flagellin [Bacteroidetes bacterium]|nr:MAG: flagellin [Bacteroidota bacterium]
MAFSTGGRINTNIGANQAYSALNTISRELGVHQLRLATGKRINSAADDASGYVISKKMEGRMRSMSAALDNVGDAQSVYGVAEGAYQTVADILTTIKEKQTRAANGAMGGDEKDAIAAEINSLMNEITDIANQTKFNGTTLLTGASNYSTSFQVGEASTDTLTVSFAKITTASGGLLSVAAGSVTSVNISDLSVDTALTTINTEIGKIGAHVNRLQTKEANITTAITNTEAAKSRIMDADVAKEQILASKLSILQQTSTAQLAQANSSPQAFLSLFR